MTPRASRLPLLQHCSYWARPEVADPVASVGTAATTRGTAVHAAIEAVAVREWRELQRRERLYRDHRAVPAVRGRTVILVDDGIATGATMRAAIRALRQLQAGRIVVAAPTMAWSTAQEMRMEADDCVAAMTPTDFRGVGQWYEDFSQTTDEEVRDLLAVAGKLATATPAPS